MEGSLVGLEIKCEGPTDKIGGEKDGAPKPDFHEVEDIAGATNKEQLHGKVVQGNPGPEQVQVASDKNHDI